MSCVQKPHAYRDIAALASNDTLMPHLRLPSMLSALSVLRGWFWVNAIHGHSYRYMVYPSHLLCFFFGYSLPVTSSAIIHTSNSVLKQGLVLRALTLDTNNLSNTYFKALDKAYISPSKRGFLSVYRKTLKKNNWAVSLPANFQEAMQKSWAS